MHTPARVGALLTALALVCLTPGTAFAPPPPPPPPIPAVRQPVDGYDLAPLWSQWNLWVESRKGPATEAILAEPDALPGEAPGGEPVFEFRKYNDYGHFLTGEVRVYCQPAKPYGVVAGTCHYRLRRAYVDHAAATYGDPNPVSRWTVASFDAVRLARHLREAGYAPDTDWWLADRAKLFAVLPSPDAMLMEQATVIRLDSRECPAFGRAMADLDRKVVATKLDMIGVGRDHRPTRYLPPHGGDVSYTIRVVAPGAGAWVKIEGGGIGRFTKLFQPMLDTADACEAARAKKTG